MKTLYLKSDVTETTAYVKRAKKFECDTGFLIIVIHHNANSEIKYKQ